MNEPQLEKPNCLQCEYSEEEHIEKNGGCVSAELFCNYIPLFKKSVVKNLYKQFNNKQVMPDWCYLKELK